uniref:Uncharacterized protein n=1 Tax=Daphnia galeata TaxID=27404 RepID=A0A8J2WBT9_9CRUS|nr:unnamed protein product [Daphnia galeata]
MFYDVDILNRRGGKFGVIWLAANGKLRLKGKGSRNDLRLVEGVRVDRICHEIMQYLKIENPPRFPEEFRPNSSFSLFLTAKLVHGVIVIHHKQVTNTLARVLLDVEQKAAKKRLKAANISCDILDLSDAAIGAESNLLNDKCTLEDREFGRLAEVVGALRIASIESSPRETHQVLSCGGQPDHSATISEMINMFESETSDPDYNNASFYVNPMDITMQEPPLIVVTLPPIDDTFDKGESNPFENPPILPLEDIADDPHVPRPSSLQRKNSKRLHSDDTIESVPSKQNRPEIIGGADDITEELPALDMVLEPVQYLPAVPRRGRRRLPRLIIDTDMVIPVERFRAQQDNYEDILRNKEDEKILLQYQECTVDHLFLRPSVDQYRIPLIKELSTRNMKTLSTDFSNFDIVEDARSNLNDFQTMASNTVAAMESHTFVAPTLIESNTNVVAAIDSFQSHATETATNLLLNGSAVTVPINPNFGENNSVVGAIRESPEKARNPNSREVSVIGSANTSNVNVSNLSFPAERSTRLSPINHKSNTVMPPIVEVSNDNIVRPDSQIGVPFVAGNIQPIDKADVGASVTVDHSLEFSVPTDGSQLPNNENVSIPHVSTSSQRECSYPQVIVPESQDLLNMIEEMMGDMSSLTFRKLVPPTKYSRLEAAKIFENLLGLTKDRRIVMKQQAPYADIVITLNR